MLFLPDTNILIGIVTGRRPDAQLPQRLIDDGQLLAACAIVVTEMYAGILAP